MTEKVKITGDIQSSTTAFADATGLFFDVAPNADYLFEFVIIFQTDTITTGIALAVNGPASPTSITLTRAIPIGLSSTTLGSARAYNSGSASTAVDTINSNLLANVKGILRNGANGGTLQLRFASEIEASVATIKAGSCGFLTKI